MNTAVVVRATAALAGHLRDHLQETPGPAPDGPGSGGGPPVAVVGHDARHGSSTFARAAAGVLSGAGCVTTLVDRPVPTPVIAAAVRRWASDAGVMVTASHNPPRDNGYKVYLGGRVAPGPGAGVQIAPPVDTDIADRIARCPAAAAVPRAGTGWTVAAPSVVDDYVGALAGTVPDGPRDVRVVATAMHGVGADVLDRVLAAAGFPPPRWVAEQREPDPDFPTVGFPNPELPGGLDRALALARQVEADIVVGLDPDADRCAMGVPDPQTPGGWRRLTGDEAGVLLGDHLLSRAAAGTLPPGPDPGRPPVVSRSVVSSTMLAAVAAGHGVPCVTTLTGFKWIARVPGLIYGYEEAIGYCVTPSLVRDKDGIATALVATGLAARLRAEGRTVTQVLDDLAVRYGVHETAPWTVRLGSGSRAEALLDRLVRRPPSSLAGRPVTRVADLAAGLDDLPPTPGVLLQAADGVRVVVRPSGTEPLLKAYLEVSRTVDSPGRLRAAREDARSVLARLRDEVAALVR
jgi:phosphomannomutase